MGIQRCTKVFFGQQSQYLADCLGLLPSKMMCSKKGYYLKACIARNDMDFHGMSNFVCGGLAVGGKVRSMNPGIGCGRMQ